MILTPSGSSAVLSGSICWGVAWSLLDHIEGVPIIGRLVKKDKIYNWVNKHKMLTISTTEVINISVHGITSPLGPLMALGGTVVNSFVVFFMIPFRLQRQKKAESRSILE